MKKWSYYLVLGLLLLFAGINFFYHLGQSSLVSWDEAWYGSIAKNLLSSKDIIHLTYNGVSFFDHPPVGFWLISLSMTIFGSNEFGVRATSAIFGIFTLLILYFLGKRLFHPGVGLAAIVALISSPWFTSRSRSGNLDIFLTFLFLSTFYLAHLTTTKKKIFPLFIVSLSLLFLTKSAIPLVIIPVILYLFWFKFKYFIVSLPISFSFLLVWLLIQSPGSFDPLFRYFIIGLPGVKTDTHYLENFLLIKSYLHYGVGNIFRWEIISLPLGIMFSPVFIPLLIFLISFLTPFFFSTKGQIWHLIPAFPFMALCFTGFIYSLLSRFHFPRASLLTLMTTLLIVLPQLNRNWRDFIDIPAFVSDEAILSRQAANYSKPIIIDEDFTPTAIFYSEKNIIRANVPTLLDIFKSYPNFVLITHDWRLSRDQVPESSYRLLKKDRDRVLIQKISTPSIP